MQFTAHEIGFMLNGTVEGDPRTAVDKLAKIEEATAGSLSFLANPKYANKHGLFTSILHFCTTLRH